MASDTEMTIREMSETFCVTPRALRFYESSGLLSPQRNSRKRLYGKADRARLKLILRGKRFGFTLEQIRDILELYDPRNHNLIQTRTALATAHTRLAEMRQQYEELAQTIIALEDQIEEGEAVLRQFTCSAGGQRPMEEG